MRGIGVVQDGHNFTWEDLERGTPRFWWGPARRAAFDRALARHGKVRKEEQGDETDDTQDDRRDDDRDWRRGSAVGAGIAIAAFEEKRGEPDGGWETKENASPASDSGGSSDGGGSDGGGGGSGE
jgi:uncharacterized membrane protein YgcG